MFRSRLCNFALPEFVVYLIDLIYFFNSITAKSNDKFKKSILTIKKYIFMIKEPQAIQLSFKTGIG